MFAGVEEFDDMHQRETLTLLNYELMLQHSIEQGCNTPILTPWY